LARARDFRNARSTAAPWICACLALCPSLRAATLKGTVTWKGHPVREARVTLPSLRLHALTDSLGRYAFDIPSGIQPPAGFGPSSGPEPLAGFRDAVGRWVSPAPWSPAFRFSGNAYPVPSGPAAGLEKSAASEGNLAVSARGYLDVSVPLSAGQAAADVSLERDYRKHMWVWQSAAATDPKERKALLDFGAEKGVGTYYIHAAGAIGSQAAALGAFLDSARARGCAVELLFGEPQWAQAAHHATVVALAGQVKAFAEAQAAKGGALPTAMQLDVEAYALESYAADSNGNGIQWIAMYEKIGAALKGTGVGVNACVPRWLDDRLVARGGETRPLSDWIADASDRLTLMDYADKPKPVIDGAAHEIGYALATGKEVVVGVETIPGIDPPSVTFAEEGEAAMDATLAAVDTAYRSKASYFGNAVHHYLTYKGMKP
jgi:hypothetical protein